MWPIEDRLSSIGHLIQYDIVEQYIVRVIQLLEYIPLEWWIITIGYVHGEEHFHSEEHVHGVEHMVRVF